MPLSLTDLSGTIRVICRRDSAITNHEAYDEYLKDLDETRLALEGVPTYFTVKLVLPYRVTQGFKRDTMEIKQAPGAETTQKGKGKGMFGDDAVVKINLANGDEEIRHALIAIDSPADFGTPIKWKKDAKDDGTDRELFAGLAALGVVADLAEAREYAIAFKPKLVQDDSQKK